MRLARGRTLSSHRSASPGRGPHDTIRYVGARDGASISRRVVVDVDETAARPAAGHARAVLGADNLDTVREDFFITARRTIRQSSGTDPLALRGSNASASAGMAGRRLFASGVLRCIVERLPGQSSDERLLVTEKERSPRCSKQSQCWEPFW